MSLWSGHSPETELTLVLTNHCFLTHASSRLLILCSDNYYLFVITLLQVYHMTLLLRATWWKVDLVSVSCQGRTLSDLPKIGDSRYLWCLDRGSNLTEVKAPKIPRLLRVSLHRVDSRSNVMSCTWNKYPNLKEKVSIFNFQQVSNWSLIRTLKFNINIFVLTFFFLSISSTRQLLCLAEHWSWDMLSALTKLSWGRIEDFCR